MFLFFPPVVFFIYICYTQAHFTKDIRERRNGRVYIYIYVYSRRSFHYIVVAHSPGPENKKNDITPSTFTRSDTQWFVNVRKRKTRANRRRYAREHVCWHERRVRKIIDIYIIYIHTRVQIHYAVYRRTHQRRVFVTRRRWAYQTRIFLLLFRFASLAQCNFLIKQIFAATATAWYKRETYII